IRAGKCLAVNAIEVRVQFKGVPLDVYPDSSRSTQHFRFRVGPDVTTLAIGMRVKRPGEVMDGRAVELIASDEEERDILTYERLPGDALRAAASLFARQDAIDAQWRVIDPVLDLPSLPQPYDPSSWGPEEADRLVAGIPGGWRKPVDPTATERRR